MKTKSNKVTKIEMVQRIAARLDIPALQVRKILDQLYLEVEESLTQGQQLSFLGLGTFTPKDYKQKKGRNPQTGEEIVIPPRKRVLFKPSSKLLKSLALGNPAE